MTLTHENKFKNEEVLLGVISAIQFGFPSPV